MNNNFREVEEVRNLRVINEMCDNGEIQQFMIEELKNDTFKLYVRTDNRFKLHMIDTDIDNLYLEIKDYIQC